MLEQMQHGGIVVVDFGSQYTQLVVRRLRELDIAAVLCDPKDCASALATLQPRGIVLSGGPESVTDPDAPTIPDCVWESKLPVLAICYGMQAMAKQFGGVVVRAREREFGGAELVVHTRCALLDGIEDRLDEAGRPVLSIWMSHSDHVLSAPQGFTAVASTATCPVAVFASEEKRYYGIQFHPEVSHTPCGQRILERFARDICGCTPTWTTRRIAEQLITQIQQQVGEGRVLLALSGGVDSSVVAALVHRAIGERLVCLFVDTGLLRTGDVAFVEQTLARHLGIPVTTVHAAEAFFGALSGLSDPEAKRKAVGACFIEVFEAHARALEPIDFLAQGTIYPDVIESARAKGKAHVIKSHHNVGGLPEVMALPLLEPLRELFKDEVRAIGLELGLPRDLIMRHPFPGPGLAVRVLGEVLPHAVESLRHADAIFLEELARAGFMEQTSQAFAVYLPVNSVAVMGDARHYGPVIALRAVVTNDFMTATSAALPHELLERCARRIVNEVADISRVVYDITSKPPATIEWE